MCKKLQYLRKFLVCTTFKTETYTHYRLLLNELDYTWQYISRSDSDSLDKVKNCRPNFVDLNIISHFLFQYRNRSCHSTLVYKGIKYIIYIICKFFSLLYAKVLKRVLDYSKQTPDFKSYEIILQIILFILQLFIKE